MTSAEAEAILVLLDVLLEEIQSKRNSIKQARAVFEDELDIMVKEDA